MSGSLALHALDDDDDFVSANGDDPLEEQNRYEFLDALSVASSPGPTTDRTSAITVQV